MLSLSSYPRCESSLTYEDGVVFVCPACAREWSTGEDGAQTECMDAVPMVDASGVGALSRFLKRCADHETKVLISELNTGSRTVLERMGVLAMANVEAVPGYGDAIARAEEIVEQQSR